MATKRKRAKKLAEVIPTHIPFEFLSDSKNHQDQKPATYRSETEKVSKLLGHSKCAEKSLAELRANAALCDRIALGQYLDLLYSEVHWLEGFSYRNESLLREYAEQNHGWPVIVSLGSRRCRDVEKLLKRLGVGTKSDVAGHAEAYWGKGGDEVGPATLCALAIVQCIQSNKKMGGIHKIVHKTNRPIWAIRCETLPELTKTTWKEWLDVGWQALLEHTNRHPENVTWLEPLGRYRRTKRQNKGGCVGAKTAASDIRDGIRKAIGQALKSMAQNSP